MFWRKSKIKRNNIILANPSSGLHSNCYSLIHYLLKKKKNYYLPKKIKEELTRPTKIYVNELNKINNKKLINGCANITGGGLLDNLIRVIPKTLSININLSKIKKIFPKKYLPYEIGFVSREKKRIKTFGKIKW